jgi:hypothetical protein
MAESVPGITMVAFLFASVIVAMVPIGGAESSGDNFNHMVNDTIPERVLIGQNISILENALTVDMPSTVAIGDKITIKGTVTSGMCGRKKAKLPVPSVALGDDFKVKGISRGADTVNIFVVGPKGSAGRAIDTGKISTNYAENIFGETVAVSTSDRTFEKNIDVDEDADTGSYIILVLSPGRDGIYNGFPSEVTPTNFALAFVTSYNQIVRFAKTREELLSMAVDATIGAAGSDDLGWFGYINVQSPRVLLDTISDIPHGEPLIVTGTTNRKEECIVLIEAKGPVTLAPETVPVTNGRFSATFDTTTAEEGSYTVTAKDEDGHMDEATVEILETATTPLPATPASEVRQTPPPAVSPKPTAMLKPTPKTPGFEVVPVIAGLLAVTYFVLIRKK